MISAKGSSLRIINDRRINLFSLFGPLVWPTRVTVERFLLFVHIPRLRKDTKALPHLGEGRRWDGVVGSDMCVCDA